MPRTRSCGVDHPNSWDSKGVVTAARPAPNTRQMYWFVVVEFSMHAVPAILTAGTARDQRPGESAHTESFKVVGIHVLLFVVMFRRGHQVIDPNKVLSKDCENNEDFFSISILCSKDFLCGILLKVQYHDEREGYCSTTCTWYVLHTRTYRVLA